MAPKYKLTYFNIEGLAEQIRFILSYGGVEFEDVRIEKVNWPELKPSTPMGKLPMLEVDGKTVHQTTAICRYLAKEFGINGKDDWEALQIDIAVDTMWDFIQQLSGLFTETDEVAKAKKQEAIIKETMPFYIPKFEEMIKSNGGYFVGGKLSRADLAWASMQETFKRVVGVEMSDGHPILKAYYEKIVELPAIKAWMEKRPKVE